MEGIAKKRTINKRNPTLMFLEIRNVMLTERQRDLSLNLGTTSRDVFLFCNKSGGPLTLPPKPALMARDISNRFFSPFLNLDDVAHGMTSGSTDRKIRDDTPEGLSELWWVVRRNVHGLLYFAMTHFQAVPSIHVLTT
ncbi:hypothetical protein J6590_014194 [Homalodisca vitripennis]|nr:hypothetical protein J6590_014194 [Homalodisca vitripennis]